jgi:hypothetical protein
MQPIDNGCEPLEYIRIAVPKFTKCSGLFFEYREDLIWRVASIDRGGEWVVVEILSSAFSKLGYGNVEEGFEVGGSGSCIGYRGHGILRGVGRCG